MRTFLAAAVMLAFSGQAIVAQTSDLPRLEKRGGAIQLIVDGKPFLALGGEVHNSSSSNVAYMAPIWPRLAAMHLNTVLVPVAWETIEPEEGRFDFSVLDGLLQGARANHLRLGLLWFGSWKNTYSSYVPGWVKRDSERFPRVQTSDGRGTERLSPFSITARDADTRAFVRLMQHLRETDSSQHTVLLVQVENEVGVIPQSRDHSPTADAAFNAPVPAALMRYIADHRSNLQPELRTAWETAGAKTSGIWREVFGNAPLTDDLFMAWHYAQYIDHVTVAGKGAYPLPMFTNAALIRPNYEPGQYNSGGPLPHSLDVWKAGAPSLDFLSPDIYFNEFTHWASSYAVNNNPLFVPETQGGAAGSANALYAFGQLRAIGFSPFGIDDQGNRPVDLAGITSAGSDADKGAMEAVYGQLNQLAPLILQKQADGGISAMMMEGDAQRGARLRIGGYIANMVRPGDSGRSGPAPRNAAMFLRTDKDEFLVVGSGESLITFTADTPGPTTVGIESIDEGRWQNGQFQPGRRLNGDENGQGQSLHLRADDLKSGHVYRVRLYRYQ